MPETALHTLSAEVDLYLAEADALKYGDHQRLLIAAQEASQRTQRLGDFQRYAQALAHQAWAYGNLNRFEAALICALEVLQLARSYGFTEIEARVSGTIAFIFCRCGMAHEAEYLYEHQVSLGQQLESGEIRAMATNDLGTLKLSSGETERAIALFREAALLMPVGTHQGIDHAIVHLNLSIACIDQHRYDEAREHAQRVLAHKADMPKVTCDAHLCMAAIHLAHDEVELAAGEVASARATIETALPDWYNDNVDQLTAELYLHEGRPSEAAQVWERMYEMTLQRQELDFAISALNHLKDVYQQMNDTAGLISAYKRLAEDIPRLQKQGSDLRFTVLRMVFALDKAAMQAELKLNQQKNAILERLSHEFRTPLTIIQSSAEMLEKYGDHMPLERRQLRLQHITEQVLNLTMMLEDIVDLLRLDENRQAEIEQAAFRLDELEQGALIELARYQAPRARISIHAAEAWVYGARQLLETVLVHLITNALKFSKEAVTVDLSVENSTVVMRVADQGIGIPKEEQEEVFKPLVRGSNLDEVKGIGIGLAIVFKLVEQMNGSIDLASAAGRGTTITVSVPFSQLHDAALP